jgi:hypothetical protein
MFRGYWFRKTTLPLAVPSATWFSFAGRAGYVKQPVHPLFEFRSPSESCPTRPSLPAETDKHLSWALLPYSTRRLGDPLATDACRASATVRPQGLVTLSAAYPPSPGRFYFTPAALMGFALRSFLLSEGIRCVSGAERPTYRLTCR